MTREEISVTVPVLLCLCFLLGQIFFFCPSVMAEESGQESKSRIEQEIDEEFKWLRAETETEMVWSASKYQQKASEAPSYSVPVPFVESVKNF